MLSSSIASQTRHLPTRSRTRAVYTRLLILGILILPDFLALRLPPTPTTANTHIPIAIQLPSESNAPLPFVTSKFNHAFPTRALGGRSRMHYVLGTFFPGPVSGEEKNDGWKPD